MENKPLLILLFRGFYNCFLLLSTYFIYFQESQGARGTPERNSLWANQAFILQSTGSKFYSKFQYLWNIDFFPTPSAGADCSKKISLAFNQNFERTLKLYFCISIYKAIMVWIITAGNIFCLWKIPSSGRICDRKFGARITLCLGGLSLGSKTRWGFYKGFCLNRLRINPR